MTTMRFIRYVIWVLIAILLVTLALANREPVTLRLMPEDIAAVLRYPEVLNSVTVPLFVVIFAGIVLGVLLGFVAEWLREHKFRSAAKRNGREANKLANELQKAKTEKADGDDVLALLDDGGAVR